MSHPAWVCGLKPYSKIIKLWKSNVTPCVGVWIETLKVIVFGISCGSHPAWVCGLKQAY